jgi:hypothetical protein
MGLLAGVSLTAFPAFGWETMNQTDPMTDATTTYVVTRAENVSACSGRRPGLILICDSVGPAALMIAEACEPLTPEDKPFGPFEVTTRIDDATAFKTTMFINFFQPELIGDTNVADQNNQASTPDFGSFVEDYLDSQQLALRYFTAAGQMETLIFRTTGMREAALSPSSLCDASMF